VALRTDWTLEQFLRLPEIKLHSNSSAAGVPAHAVVVGAAAHELRTYRQSA
jgi:hypothetical protein